MKLLDNIPRIKSPPFFLFKKRYLLPQRPVILTDLFDGQAIRRITTPRRARAALGHLPLALQVKPRFPYAELLGPQPKRLLAELGLEQPARHRQYCSLDEYLDLVRRSPETTAKCADQPTPAELLELAALPEGYRFNDGSPADHVSSAIYLANRGAVTRLHYDPDGKHALLYQIFGVKRVILISPRMSKLLMPYSGNGSLLTLQNMPEAERRRLLEFVGGFGAVLRPGETLYIPPLWWHFMEYESAAMSVNFRYGWNSANEFIARHLHHNVYSQGLGAKLYEPGRRSQRRARRVLRRLRGAYVRAARSPMERYDRIQLTMEELYAEICPENMQGTCWFPLDRFFTRNEKRRIAKEKYSAKALARYLSGSSTR